MPSVSSSVIRAAAYDEELEELTVTFTSGKRYVYFDVPEWVYDGLLAAESAGEYFNRHIKDRYRYGELRRR